MSAKSQNLHSRDTIRILGMTLAFVAVLESSSRGLSLLGLAKQTTCTFLTLLSVCLLCWSALFLTRRIRSRSSVMLVLAVGASLVVVSQTMALLAPFVVGYFAPSFESVYLLLKEIALIIGVSSSLFGLYLSALETDRVKVRLQRERERLRQEIEDRERVEQALRQNEVKYRALVDGFPHAALIVSKGRIVFANPMAAAMMRQESPQNLMGADPMQFVVAGDRERVVANMRGRFLVGREAPETDEITLVRTNGKTFPALVTVGMIPFMDSVASQIVIVDLTQQKQVEQALRESENRLRTVMEATSDGYWDFNVVAQSTYYSPAFATMIGYEPEEMRGDTSSWLERLHPEDREHALNQFQRHACGDTPRYEAEYRMYTKDGSMIWALSRGRVVERDADGAPLRIVGTHTDITQRKQADEALRQAYAAVELRVQQRTASLMEANTRLKEEITERKRTEQSLRESQAQLANAQRIGRMGNWVQNLVTLELTWSDEIYRIFEISRTDFTSTQQAFFDCVHPDDRQEIFDLAERVYRGEAEYDIEHRVVLPNGQEKIVHEHAELLRDKSGEPLKLVGTVQDITERKEAEKALRRSEEKYRSLLEGLSEAVFKYSLTSRRLEYLGPAALDVFGYSAEEFVARPELFREVLHPESRNILNAFATGEIPPMMEYRVIDPAGGVRWIIQSNALVYDQHGQPVAVEGLARNVTQRREAEREIEEHRTWLVEASKMSALGEMAASIAHEINNPLNIISGSAEQLQRVLEAPHMGPEVASRLAESIMRHVFRIKKIVQGLRNFTRDSSQDPFQDSLVKTILEEAIILCQDRFATHGVALVVADVPDDLMVECRPAQIMEVLVNLLSNALHAVEHAEVKRVEVHAQAGQESVSICVSDTGPGVPDEIGGKIFEPLVTTKQHGKGTGLGLSISKRIIESHRGSITFGRSESVTWFRLDVPRLQARGGASLPA